MPPSSAFASAATIEVINANRTACQTWSSCVTPLEKYRIGHARCVDTCTRLDNSAKSLARCLLWCSLARHVVLTQRVTRGIHISYTCNTHVIHMRYTGQTHVMHMSNTCHAHVKHMSNTCHTHVKHMSNTCHTHVIHMSYTCVIHMCLTHVSYTAHSA